MHAVTKNQLPAPLLRMRPINRQHLYTGFTQIFPSQFRDRPRSVFPFRPPDARMAIWRAADEAIGTKLSRNRIGRCTAGSHARSYDGIGQLKPSPEAADGRPIIDGPHHFDRAGRDGPVFISRALIPAPLNSLLHRLPLIQADHVTVPISAPNREPHEGRLVPAIGLRSVCRFAGQARLAVIFFIKRRIAESRPGRDQDRSRDDRNDTCRNQTPHAHPFRLQINFSVRSFTCQRWNPCARRTGRCHRSRERDRARRAGRSARFRQKAGNLKV